MREFKSMHWPPLPNDPQQADALSAISKWPHEKRMDALRKAYGPEFAAMSKDIAAITDTAERYQAIRALSDRFGPVDHCKVLKAGLNAKP